MTTWEHIIVEAIAVIPATIAAWSSMKNGRTLKNNGRSMPRDDVDRLGEGWRRYYESLKLADPKKK